MPIEPQLIPLADTASLLRGGELLRQAIQHSEYCFNAVAGEERQRRCPERLEFAPDRIAFARPGMAITLNGIGQGYITDRIVDLLHAGGVEHTLVDMGETRALGAHPSGEPWRVGIEDPRMPGQIAERVLLKDRAIATSGGYGTQFDSAGRFNHIFDPTNGHTSSRYRAVSTIASTATEADALSTAFCLMPLEQVRAVVQARKLSAHLAMPDGRRVLMEG
jgi:thiamine biosynthesis lipoprotein